MLKFGKKGIITFLVAALVMVFASGAWAATEIGQDNIKELFNKAGDYILSGNIVLSGDTKAIELSKDITVTLDLNGHTISADTSIYRKFESKKLEYPGSIIYATSGDITIKDGVGGGKICDTSAAEYSEHNDGVIRVEKGTHLTIEKAIIEVKNGVGITARDDGTRVTFKDGEIKVEYGFGIGTNGLNITEPGSGIYVEGGTITVASADSAAIYHPSSGTLSISGGTLSAADGIQVKAGNVIITGGTITATGKHNVPLDGKFSGSGTNELGNALSLISHASYKGQSMDVKISGSAMLIAEHADAIGVYVNSGDESHVDSFVITGGSYSSDPSDYVDKTICTIVEKDGLFTVKGKAAPIVTPVEPKFPDGTSDDVKAEIKPATEVVLLGVDTTKSAITEETKAAAIDKAMAVISADITSKDLTVNEETGVVEIAVATASEAAKGLLKDNETLASKDIAPLPVFTAKVDEGKTAMVSYQLTSSALKAKTAEEVRVMKILSSTTAGEFEYASEITADMDGKFTIQNTDGKIHSGALKDDTDYLLTLFIKDGSSFDLDGAENGSITDPAAIFSTTTTEPQHGSSSSGCNGGFGALALLGLALVPMFYGKKR